MKVRITQKGVFGADKKEIPVGTVVDVKGDKMPGAFVNKAKRIDGSGGKTAVTNPKKDAKQEPQAD